MMVEQSPLSVQILSPDGRTIQVNAAWEKLWGAKLEDLHNYNILEDDQLVERGIMPYIKQAFSGETAEIPATPYSPAMGIYAGQDRWSRAVIYPVKVEGQITQVVLIHEDITDQKRAEAALQTSEERHRAIFENAQDAILLADDNSRYIDANPAACKLTGYSKEELLGMSVQDLTPHELAEQYKSSWSDFRQTGVMGGLYPILRKDGTQAVAQFRAVADVMPGVHVSILQDITERTEAEEGRRQSEERFRELADSMPAIVWSSKVGEGTDFLNRHYYDYTGLSRDISGEKGWELVVHPDDLAVSHASYSKAALEGIPWEQELRLKRNDGEYRWHLSRSIPIRDSDGQIVRWYATSTDIHDQKLAEQRARDEAFALETVNRIGQSLSSELDLDRLVQSLTDAATELVGAEFGSFFYNVTNDAGESLMLYTISGVPRSAFDRFPMPRNTAIFAPTFTGEGVVRSENITLDPRYGKNPPYFGMPEGHLPVRSYLAVPVVSRSGEAIGGLFFGHSEAEVFGERHEQVLLGIASQAAVAIDNARLYHGMVTMNAELEERVGERTSQLVAANKEMEGFTYSVSHDLRGPLRAIMSTSMILKEDFGDKLPPDAIDQLDRQARAANKMGSLIDDLLRLSRIGRQDMSRSAVNLSELATDVVGELAPRCEALDIDIEPELMAKVDAKLYRLVILNLFDNACKFSPNGGKITFGQSDTDRGPAFFLRDEGIGFEMQYAEKLFLPFERLVLDTEFPGTGIGLANVKRIVERHGGQVWAEGDPGKGSTFYFTVP
ncbi:MAG: hypothetical protein QOJ65_2074 [Fimbriimonadaceae bacterium]|nr:hypothetical protein [Fimbriimonadaceae bacterium]